HAASRVTSSSRSTSRSLDHRDRPMNGSEAPARTPLSYLRVRPGWLLAGLLIVAGLIRSAIVIFGPLDVVYPDEIFQYTEQAHRIVYGSGVVPWEIVVGVRSWLLPLFIAGLMKLLSFIGGEPLVYI